MNKILNLFLFIIFLNVLPYLMVAQHKLGGAEKSKKEHHKKEKKKKDKNKNDANNKHHKKKKRGQEDDEYATKGKHSKHKKHHKKGDDEENNTTATTDNSLDIKTRLKDKMYHGNRTSGGSFGGADQVDYRPVYVGSKIVTGTIQSVQGFRVCIYTGNSREEAIKLKLEFMKGNPNTRSYMSYNTPYYKIKVGDYADKKQAQAALKAITKSFNSAFLVPDVVTVKNIIIYKPNH